jgi:CRP/FNR family transcriptional regulator/CRP/FNR family cyclic AMP-dependent transcriptional regulator
MREHEAIIRDVPLLARLPEADLRDLASRGRVQSYRSGVTLFREGDPGDALHVVIGGNVRVVVLSPEGSEATVAMLGPGEFVGDLALLDGRPRSASAVASEPTKTLVVTRDDFADWLSRRPKAALALLETLSLRVRRTDEALTDLSFLDLPHRLAKRLWDLAAARSSQGGGHVRANVRLRITQAELASMLGVSRESVNKQLNAFARAGLLKLGRGSVTLLDPEALRTFA